MLAENLENWAQQERQAGRQEGLQEAEHRALESNAMPLVNSLHLPK
ncbi:hypothetical protein ACIGG6_15960 [Vreelandella lionensis]|uniref:Uncharacterized protein n=1 Tax=Vreelandella lionensis TaxID=1144478 RepID=A0ABW8BZ00_9GAMM